MKIKAAFIVDEDGSWIVAGGYDPAQPQLTLDEIMITALDSLGENARLVCYIEADVPNDLATVQAQVINSKP